MATTRLRKAFRYPDDSEDDDEPLEGIDEEEQEKIISALHEQDAFNTALYLKVFLCLPILCTLPYIPTAFAFASLLAITSLVSSAYTLYFVPLVPGTSRNVAYLHDDSAWRAWRQYFDEDGPVNKFIVPLNALLSGLLGLQGFVQGRRSGWVESEGLWGALPLIIFLLILVVRTQLRPVDVKELEKLRYRYKGA